MASGFPPRNQKLAVSFLLSCLYSVMVRLASSTLILHGPNVSLSLEDVRANFAPPVESTGICGKLYLADPLDACSSLRNEIGPVGNSTSPFVLTIRGNCIFEDKVRVAQRAGFKAVIVYDNEDDDPLVTMAGNPNGIKIHAVFVSKASGEKLSNYIGSELVDVCLVGGFENSAWSIMAISFISLLSISALLGICFFVRRLHIRRERPPARVREFHGMSGRLVKAMPSLVFTSVLDDDCTSATCAICLEDYKVGEKIRILPCKHKFHAICVDCWLTTWRTFCPVCKQDARTTSGIPTASESTPLLHSHPSSAASTPVSVRSSYLSSARQITASPSQRSHPSSSIDYSLSNSSRLHLPIRRHHNPSASMMSVSRSSMDLQSIPRSVAQMGSPNSYSYGYPSISPLNSQYIMSSYSPSHASSSYLVGYSSHHQNLLHHSASVVSLSHYDSAHSLPGFDARSER